MSGEKVSTYSLSPEQIRRMREAQERAAQIRRERAERNQILKKISQEQQAILVTSNKIKGLLRSTPQGLQDTFSTSVQDAEQWMKAVQDRKNVDSNNSNEVLNAHVEKFRSQGQRGQKCYQSLIKNFTEEADEITKSIRVELQDLNLKYESNRESINTWAGLSEMNKIAKDLIETERCINDKKLKEAVNKKVSIAEYLDKEITSIDRFSTIFDQYNQDKETLIPWFAEEIQDMDQKFGDLKAALKEGKHTAVLNGLNEIQKDLDKKNNEANILDEKDQKRQYVFESLKKVCNSMGFDEVKQSVEGSGISSRIVYTIDTYTQGKIRFYISLDSINADSGIVENHCISEFDKVSESLQKNFGVQTKFKRIHEQPDSKYISDKHIDGGSEDTGRHIERGQQI